MNRAKDPIIEKQRRRYYAVSLILALLVSAAFLIFKKFSVPVVLGALLGAAASCISFYMLGESVQKALDTGDENSAKLKIQGSYYLRLLVVAVFLVVSIKVSFFDWVSCAAAVLVIKTLAPYIVRYIEMKDPQTVRWTGKESDNKEKTEE